eukprot:scaffold29471_cov28-Tisochrysis_lutea.AAC.1
MGSHITRLVAPHLSYKGDLGRLRRSCQAACRPSRSHAGRQVDGAISSRQDTAITKKTSGDSPTARKRLLT